MTTPHAALFTTQINRGPTTVDMTKKRNLALRFFLCLFAIHGVQTGVCRRGDSNSHCNKRKSTKLEGVSVKYIIVVGRTHSVERIPAGPICP